MLREEKSEKHGQCILYSTMTATPKVRRPLIMKCFVWEQAYDKVESDCAMRSLILIFNFIFILIQETRILKKIQPYLAIYDIYLFSCKLLQFNLKVSLHWGFVMHRHRIGKKVCKRLAAKFIYNLRCQNSGAFLLKQNWPGETGSVTHSTPWP